MRNFRNIAGLYLRLLPGSVIVGENRAGKSNLIEALRLIFDPAMSFADRQPAAEDFWMSEADLQRQKDPMAEGDVIEIRAEIVEFEDDSRLASSPDSRQLYLRHGYADCGHRIELPGGPALYPMWRQRHDSYHLGDHP